MKPAPYTLSPEIISDYQRDGAVCIRGAFKGWVDTIAAGIERNLREKSATAVDIAGGKGSFFDDHVLVKEPGTQKPTPWHQDIPYYFVDGQQTVSFWIPIDPVKEATLRLVAG